MVGTQVGRENVEAAVTSFLEKGEGGEIE